MPSARGLGGGLPDGAVAHLLVQLAPPPTRSWRGRSPAGGRPSARRPLASRRSRATSLLTTIAWALLSTAWLLPAASTATRHRGTPPSSAGHRLARHDPASAGARGRACDAVLPGLRALAEQVHAATLAAWGRCELDLARHSADDLRRRAQRRPTNSRASRASSYHSLGSSPATTTHSRRGRPLPASNGRPVPAPRGPRRGRPAASRQLAPGEHREDRPADGEGRGPEAAGRPRSGEARRPPRRRTARRGRRTVARRQTLRGSRPSMATSRSMGGALSREGGTGRRRGARAARPSSGPVTAISRSTSAAGGSNGSPSAVARSHPCTRHSMMRRCRATAPGRCRRAPGPAARRARVVERSEQLPDARVVRGARVVPQAAVDRTHGRDGLFERLAPEHAGEQLLPDHEVIDQLPHVPLGAGRRPTPTDPARPRQPTGR